MKTEHVQTNLQSVGEYKRLCRGLTIAVPTMDQKMNSGLTRLLMTAAQLGASFITVDEMRPNEYARNILAGMFLSQPAQKCQRLWFIDNDMRPPNDALDLLKVKRGHRGGIVSGRCVFSSGTRFIPNSDVGIDITFNGFKYLKGRRPPFKPLTSGSGVESIDACGTACIIIDRQVLEDRSVWNDGEYTNPLTGDECDCSKIDETNKMLIPPIFKARHAPNGQPLISQDIDFTWRVKQAGYTVSYAHDIHFGHLKSVNMDVILNYVGGHGYEGHEGPSPVRIHEGSQVGANV